MTPEIEPVVGPKSCDAKRDDNTAVVPLPTLLNVRFYHIDMPTLEYLPTDSERAHRVGAMAVLSNNVSFQTRPGRISLSRKGGKHSELHRWFNQVEAVLTPALINVALCEFSTIQLFLDIRWTVTHTDPVATEKGWFCHPLDVTNGEALAVSTEDFGL